MAVMQRVCRLLRPAVSARLLGPRPLVHALPLQCRLLSVSDAPKLGRFARRKLKKSGVVPDQKPARQPQVNVHRLVVQQQTPLEKVLPLVQQLVDSIGTRQRPARTAIDGLFFHCAQQAEKRLLSRTLRSQVLQFFDDELFKPDEAFAMGHTLNEAVFSSVIKLRLSEGEAEAAWLLIKKLVTAMKDGEKLHFRTVSPLLEHACRHGQFPSAYMRWQQLKGQHVEWTSAMEDVLVQMIAACLKHNEGQPAEYMVPESGDSESHFHAQMASLLHDLQIVCREVAPDNAQRLVHAFRDAGYNVVTVASDERMRPHCPSCGHALIKQGLTEDERLQMLTAIESRRTKVGHEPTVKPYLQPFREWLMLRHQTFLLENAAEGKGGQPLHYVLDGPNLAYVNQNFDDGTYRVDHVDAVARGLQAQGHLVSITVPAVYLAERFVERIRAKNTKAARRKNKFTTRERTPAEKAVLARWKEQDMVFSCRTDVMSDDLFWLYASVLLGREGRVVTNDQGRDHIYAMLNGYSSTSTMKENNNRKPDPNETTADASAEPLSLDLIIRWKELTNVNIDIKHQDLDENALAPGELIPIEYIKLLHPLPFSRVPQVTAPDHFHFPVAEHANQSEQLNQSSTSKRTKWLCAYRTDAPAS